MYAVVATGGKQYKVEPGEVLRVEKIPGDVGAQIAFDQVLMVGEGESVRIGQPVIDGATVTGHIIEQDKSKENPGIQVQTPKKIPPQTRSSSTVHCGKDRRHRCVMSMRSIVHRWLFH